MTTIDRRKDLSYKEFIEKYQKPGIPVILENATQAWKSNLIFTPDFFREKFGDRTTWFSNKQYTVSELLDLTANSTKENPAPYPVKFNILTQLPEIQEFMDPMDMNMVKPNWLNHKILKNKLGNGMDLHIGGAGNCYSVHKDAYDVHAWLIQLYGEKDVIIFPRDQEELMYPGKGGLLESRSPIDISNPDYEKYPRFREATPTTITLKAGEVLYIPSGIWHTTQAHGQNISTIIDQVNSSNYKAWRRDVYVYKKYHNKYRAILDYGAATAIGNAFKLGELMGMKF
ncbi:cupin-like domain-containing protein [Pedobacter gandavensis]|uniref:cupin-like domain-containing protein n=1 Tax=Pedobacter gandavensis TaxID=2679963 RepID=UPI00292F426B|nr:cupin-like domain-containing protein [Pedobacter gandavensis]